MSGIEADAFESAIGLLVEGSILEKTKLNILKTKGTGRCIGCNLEFEMDQRMGACPVCGAFPSEIIG
jgi:Zn finger protein HypA/HybF involved in hydrogenase expression